jgi:hypothetical protein
MNIAFQTLNDVAVAPVRREIWHAPRPITCTRGAYGRSLENRRQRDHTSWDT